MTVRFHITLGATTSAGGQVVTATSNRSVDGVAVACAGDAVHCPGCGSEGVIEPHGARISERFNGREFALSDDLCRCKCAPPPRLIANQTFSRQTVDVEWAATRVNAAAEAVARLNTAGSSARLEPDGIPLLLFDPVTGEPHRHRSYKLELKTGVVEGTTDQHGATKLLTATERASFIRWHVDGGIAAT